MRSDFRYSMDFWTQLLYNQVCRLYLYEFVSRGLLWGIISAGYVYVFQKVWRQGQGYVQGTWH